MANIPTTYLRWAAETIDLDYETSVAVEKEIHRRGTRFVDAWHIVADIEDTLLSMIHDNRSVDHDQAAIIGDLLQQTIDAIKLRWEMGSETRMAITGCAPVEEQPFARTA